MKALRVFLSVVVSLILILLVVVTSILFSVSNIIRGEVVTELLKTSIVENAKETGIDTKVVDEIFDDKDAKVVINNVMDDVLASVKAGEAQIDDETIDSAIAFLKEHKGELEEITGEEIDIEQISSEENITALKEGLNDTIKELNADPNNTVSTVVEAYAAVTSASTRLALIGAIVFQILLLGLLSWSVYKWLLPTGISLIVSGVIVSSIYAIVRLLLLDIAKSYSISINAHALIISGAISLVIGIVSVVIYAIVNKKKKVNAVEA